MSRTSQQSEGYDIALAGSEPLTRASIAIGFAVLCASYMLNAMNRQLFYPLLPDIRAELGFSLEQGGLLATGFTLGLALAGLPTGYLADRLSRKAIILVSVLVYSLGTLAIPLATVSPT
ncbi:MFS transporter [Streptomyces flavidovirens]|uniref:MFS transporter n=1 Tax=Streptomyces flavidovirens TaxID=67298 RepID=UPI003426AA13